MTNYDENNKWTKWLVRGGEMPQFEFDRVTENVVIDEEISERKKPLAVPNEEVQDKSKRVLGQEVRK